MVKLKSPGDRLDLEANALFEKGQCRHGSNSNADALCNYQACVESALVCEQVTPVTSADSECFSDSLFFHIVVVVPLRVLCVNNIVYSLTLKLIRGNPSFSILLLMRFLKWHPGMPDPSNVQHQAF